MPARRTNALNTIGWARTTDSGAVNPATNGRRAYGLYRKSASSPSRNASVAICDGDECGGSRESTPAHRSSPNRQRRGPHGCEMFVNAHSLSRAVGALTSHEGKWKESGVSVHQRVFWL